MGDVSRMRWSGRFIKTFNDLFVEHSGLKPGDVLTVERVCLGEDNGDGYNVALVVALRDAKGQEVELQGDTLYDPDWTQDQDILDRLTDDLDLDEDEALIDQMNAEGDDE